MRLLVSSFWAINDVNNSILEASEMVSAVTFNIEWARLLIIAIRGSPEIFYPCVQSLFVTSYEFLTDPITLIQHAYCCRSYVPGSLFVVNKSGEVTTDVISQGCTKVTISRLCRTSQHRRGLWKTTEISWRNAGLFCFVLFLLKCLRRFLIWCEFFWRLFIFFLSLVSDSNLKI
jgi:hypothetical protein